MRKAWVLILVFFGVAAFIAGCGGSDDNRGYVNPYEGEVSGKKGTAPLPTSSGAKPGTSSKEPVGDATGGGEYGERKFERLNRPGEVGEAQWREMESIGKDASKAHTMFQQYMLKKTKDGTKDTGMQQSAMTLLDQVITRCDALLEKYPNDPTLQEYRKTATEDRHALAWE